MLYKRNLSFILVAFSRLILVNWWSVLSLTFLKRILLEIRDTGFMVQITFLLPISKYWRKLKALIPASKSPIGVMLSWSTVGLLRKAASLVLDQVCHFRPIPIHRFFAVNRIRYRYDTDFFIRFKSGRGTAWRTDQRLQTPPPQLITAVRRGPVAARRRMPLICRGQSNTATISKV